MSCERVRAQVSLQLDGELSELERRMMQSHLARCEDCGAYEHGVVSVTSLLREAPLEQAPYPLVVRLPRRISVAYGQVAGVAAVFVIMVAGVLSTFAQSEQQQLPAIQFGDMPVRYETRSELVRELGILSGGRGYEGGPAVPV